MSEQTTKFKQTKHVDIIVNLVVGEKVKVGDAFGSPLRGKTLTIEEFRLQESCESGVMVRLSDYPRFIDSNWIEKIGGNS